ncbi:MAG: MgtC/SapB family protein [bacterium]|nr:MgtC/SapB family protein [bacterium]
MFKLLLASLLGAVIGFERDVHGRAAGLRTHLLVCLGSAVFMLLSESIAVAYSKQVTDTLMRADPTRIAAQIITGIGFLGAGTIIKFGFSIRGLTTAACLWLTAAIGMSIGAGFFDIGISTTIIGLFALVVLNRVDSFYSRNSYRVLKITAPSDSNTTEIIDLIKRKHLKIVFLDKEKNYYEQTTKLYFTLKLRHKDSTDKLSHSIISDLEESGVTLYSVKWTRQ